MNKYRTCIFSGLACKLSDTVSVGGVMVEIKIAENNLWYILNTFFFYCIKLQWYDPQRCQTCIDKVIGCLELSSLLRH